MMNRIQLWFEQARKDLEVAKKLLEDSYYYASAFFCQQAVEKALKALYLKKKREVPPPTHSLVVLGNELKVDRKLFDFLRRLSTEFIATRYPDVIGDVPYKHYDREVAEYYISNAEVLFQWIERKLSED